MTIANNTSHQGIAYEGTWTVANGATLHIPYPYVVDTQWIHAVGGAVDKHPEAASAAAYKVSIPDGAPQTFLGRTADLYVSNDSGGAVVISVSSTQTDIPRAQWTDLPTEGISAHTGVTNS